MIVKEEFLSRLKLYFSLNLYEVKIWTALLSRGVSTAGELSDIANVPRSRSYDVLESLEKKGFVVMKFGKPIKYMAVPPEEVVERVKKNMRLDAETKVKRLEDLKKTEVLGELKTLFTQGVELVEPSDLSGSLRGRHNLYNHIDFTLKSAENTITIVTTTAGLIRKIESLKGTLEKAKKKGVTIRIAAPITNECKSTIADLKGIAEVRHLDKLNARFIVIDSKELIFMVLDDKDVHPTYDVGIWVNTPLFSLALEQLFELAWKDMKPALKMIKA